MFLTLTLMLLISTKAYPQHRRPSVPPVDIRIDEIIIDIDRTGVLPYLRQPIRVEIAALMSDSGSPLNTIRYFRGCPNILPQDCMCVLWTASVITRIPANWVGQHAFYISIYEDRPNGRLLKTERRTLELPPMSDESVRNFEAIEPFIKGEVIPP